jgi:hypothetical protein
MISFHSTHYKIISYPPGEDVIIKYLAFCLANFQAEQIGLVCSFIYSKVLALPYGQAFVKCFYNSTDRY